MRWTMNLARGAGGGGGELGCGKGNREIKTNLHSKP